MHRHYREIKAIDGMYKLPSEEIMSSKEVMFTIHIGTRKNILGV